MLNEFVKHFQQRALRLLISNSSLFWYEYIVREHKRCLLSKMYASPLSSPCFVDYHKRGDADETDQLLPALEETIF